MKPKHRRAAVFFASLTFIALLFWIAGYDFDRRGADVAIFLGLAVLASIGAVFFSDALEHDHT